MINYVVKKVIGTKNDREVKRISKKVIKINELEKARDQILHNHNFNSLLEYSKKLLDSLTDEKIELFEIDKLPTNTLPDIRYMIEEIVKRLKRVK